MPATRAAKPGRRHVQAVHGNAHQAVGPFRARGVDRGRRHRYSVAFGATSGAKPAPAAMASGSAPGGPGTTAYMDVARKDCFGTARDTRSKVWFTVADGVLSDVFSPTIENSNVNTVQYIVTDGKTFADLQQRDMTYLVSSPDRSGMVCRVQHRRRAPLSPGQRLHRRPSARQRPRAHEAGALRLRAGFDRRAENLRSRRRDDRQHRWGWFGERRTERRDGRSGHDRARVLRTQRSRRARSRRRWSVR